MERMQNPEMPMMRRRVLGGFTLIELLVVVGIIALLIAILLPALQRAMSEARKVTCASQMRQWGTAANAYGGEWRGRFPRNVSGAPYLYTLRGSEQIAFLREYLNVDFVADEHHDPEAMQVLYCPTTERYRDQGLYVTDSGTRERVNIGYTWWPYAGYMNVGEGYSERELWVDELWYVRQRFDTRARNAPILQDHWRHARGDNVFDFDQIGPSIRSWTAHRDLGRSDDEKDSPGGMNSLYEDGSVRWHNAEEILPGHSRDDDRVIRHVVPGHGLPYFEEGAG